MTEKIANLFNNFKAAGKKGTGHIWAGYTLDVIREEIEKELLMDEEIAEIKPTHEEIDRINQEARRYEPKEFRGCYANDELTKVRRHRIAQA